MKTWFRITIYRIDNTIRKKSNSGPINCLKIVYHICEQLILFKTLPYSGLVVCRVSGLELTHRHVFVKTAGHVTCPGLTITIWQNANESKHFPALPCQLSERNANGIYNDAVLTMHIVKTGHAHLNTISIIHACNSTLHSYSLFS